MSSYAIVTLDDSSNKSISGVHNYIRSQGGVLIIPAGTAFPSPTEAGELFYNQTDGILYRRDDPNVSWVGLTPGTQVVPESRQVIAGDGLTGGGTLASNVTLDVAPNADGSIVVAPNDIRVGVINDTQHGTRGGGTQHSAATTSVAGFMSPSDKTKLDGLGDEVPETRTLTAGISIAGGGDLSADRTFNLGVEAVTVAEAVGGQSISAAIATIDFDTVEVNTGSFFSYANPVLTIQATGFYCVSYTLNLDKQSSNNRTVSGASVFVDGALVPRSISYGYHRTLSQGQATLGATVFLPMTAGQQVTLRASRVSGSGNLGVIGSSQSSLTVWRAG